MKSRFSWIVFFTSFLLFKIVDDEGVGADTPDDIADFEIEDEDDTPIAPVDEAKTLHDDELKALKEENEKNSEWIAEQKANIATTNAIETLVSKYADFDASKIADFLANYEKEHGEDEAEKMNNPLGWENIYLTQFKKESKKAGQDFDRGRGDTKEPFDLEKATALSRNGDEDAQMAIFRNSKGM